MRWLAIALVTLAPICAAAEPASQPGSSFESVARRWRARLPALPSLAIKMRCPADPDGVPDATHSGADTGPGPQIALRIGASAYYSGRVEFSNSRRLAMAVGGDAPLPNPPGRRDHSVGTGRSIEVTGTDVDLPILAPGAEVRLGLRSGLASECDDAAGRDVSVPVTVLFLLDRLSPNAPIFYFADLYDWGETCVVRAVRPWEEQPRLGLLEAGGSILMAARWPSDLGAGPTAQRLPPESWAATPTCRMPLGLRVPIHAGAVVVNSGESTTGVLLGGRTYRFTLHRGFAVRDFLGAGKCGEVFDDRFIYSLIRVD